MEHRNIPRLLGAVILVVVLTPVWARFVNSRLINCSVIIVDVSSDRYNKLYLFYFEYIHDDLTTSYIRATIVFRQYVALGNLDLRFQLSTLWRNSGASILHVAVGATAAVVWQGLGSDELLDCEGRCCCVCCLLYTSRCV